MKEVKNTVRFVTIPNFPNYCIGEDGKVWSDNRKRYLKWYRGKGCERPHVTLFHNGNSANNHYTNIEWCRNQTGSKYGK